MVYLREVISNIYTLYYTTVPINVVIRGCTRDNAYACRFIAGVASLLCRDGAIFRYSPSEVDFHSDDTSCFCHNYFLTPSGMVLLDICSVSCRGRGRVGTTPLVLEQEFPFLPASAKSRYSPAGRDAASMSVLYVSSFT